MKINDLLTEAKKPTPPKTRSPAAASLADRKFQQKIIPNKKKKIDPKHKKTVGIDESSKPSGNFSIDDIKKLERVRDFSTMKLMAKELIATPSQKPMKPEKVAWFNRQIDSLKSPMQLIKLMYDLMLSGEGHSVVGSKNSMASNNYRQKFGEEYQDPNEYDMEGDSVKTNLHTIVRACKQLNSALADDQNLPEWVQDKVAQAKGMMVGVTEYMLSTHERDPGMDEAANPAQQAAIAIAKKKKKGVAEQRSLAEPRIVTVGDDTQGLNDFRVVGPNHLSIYPFPAKQWNNEQQQARAKGYQLQYVGNDPAKAKAAAWPGETPKSRPMAVKEARKSAWDKMAGAVKSSTGKDLNKGDERAQDALKGLKKSAKDYQNVVDKDNKTNEGSKQKGVDGKACWDGYKRMGTKKKGGKTVDNCVPTGK